LRNSSLPITLLIFQWCCAFVDFKSIFSIFQIYYMWGKNVSALSLTSWTNMFSIPLDVHNCLNVVSTNIFMSGEMCFFIFQGSEKWVEQWEKWSHHDDITMLWPFPSEDDAEWNSTWGSEYNEQWPEIQIWSIPVESGDRRHIPYSKSVFRNVGKLYKILDLFL
jgi:hypothetical protein